MITLSKFIFYIFLNPFILLLDFFLFCDNELLHRNFIDDYIVLSYIGVNDVNALLKSRFVFILRGFFTHFIDWFSFVS